MIRSIAGYEPKIHPKAFVHDSAEIIGKVSLGSESSIFPGVVLRGDIDRIVIGARSNVQDLSVVHTREGLPTIVGRGVTIGHGVILHGCRIGDQSLVGMGAIVMEANIGSRVLIGAGALVPGGMRVPSGVLLIGAPAKVSRKLRPDELRMLVQSERNYIALSRKHASSSRVLFGR